MSTLDNLEVSSAVSWSHVCVAGAKLLVVFRQITVDPTGLGYSLHPTIWQDGITYGGEPLTLSIQFSINWQDPSLFVLQPFAQDMQIWSLANPPAGANLVVFDDGSQSQRGMSASFTDPSVITWSDVIPNASFSYPSTASGTFNDSEPTARVWLGMVTYDPNGKVEVSASDKPYTVLSDLSMDIGEDGIVYSVNPVDALPETFITFTITPTGAPTFAAFPSMSAVVGPPTEVAVRGRHFFAVYG